MSNLKDILKKYNKVALNCKTIHETKECLDLLYDNGYCFGLQLDGERYYLKEPVVLYIDDMDFSWSHYQYYFRNENNKEYKLIDYIIFKRSYKLKNINNV